MQCSTRDSEWLRIQRPITRRTKNRDAAIDRNYRMVVDDHCARVSPNDSDDNSYWDVHILTASVNFSFEGSFEVLIPFNAHSTITTMT